MIFIEVIGTNGLSHQTEVHVIPRVGETIYVDGQPRLRVVEVQHMLPAYSRGSRVIIIVKEDV